MEGTGRTIKLAAGALALGGWLCACAGSAPRGAPVPATPGPAQPGAPTPGVTPQSPGGEPANGQIGEALPPDPNVVETKFKGFLNPADLAAPGTLRQIAKDELADLMNGYRDVFFLRNPTEKQFNPGDCYDRIFDTAAYKASKTGAVFELTSPDISGCLNEAQQTNDKLTIHFDKASVKYYEKFSCDGVDVSVYNDKRPSQIGAAELQTCATAKSADQLVNSVIEYAFTLTPKSGGSLSLRSLSVVAYMTADGTSCHGTQAGGKWTYEPCSYVASTLYTDFKESGNVADLKQVYQNTYFKADGVGLTGKTTGAFYDGGAFNVLLNGWTGKLTYTSESANPQWQLSSGADQATGTFTGAAGP